MPQMMPINWILSFFLFIVIFIIFNIMNYYIMDNKFENKKNNLNTKYSNDLNWKW